MAVGLPPGVKEVQRIAAPGGGYYVLGSDGGVFAISDEQGRTPSSFYGSYQGLQQNQKTLGPDAFAKGNISLNPTGGYSVSDNSGHDYDFDTNYARANGYNVPDQGSTLPADPAFLAFLRTSGLGVDTAAADVARRTGAINTALQTSIGDIGNQYDQTAKNTQGGYEARGILRSGETQQGLDQVERARGSAIASAQQGAAGQIADLNSGLVTKILGVQSDAAEKGITTADTQAADAWGTQMKQRYPQYFAAGGTA